METIKWLSIAGRYTKMYLDKQLEPLGLNKMCIRDRYPDGLSAYLCRSGQCKGFYRCGNYQKVYPSDSADFHYAKTVSGKSDHGSLYRCV